MFDLVIVGAGFAGMYMLHRARGQGLRARVYEAGTDVGGTWYWNRYPGARCDVDSLEYSYQFSAELQQEWQWTERFAAQPEILRYASHVADRFDLRRDMQFETRVESAHWDDAAALWTVRTSRGETVQARFVILATGCLSSTNLPDIAGRDSFQGKTYHTGLWPHEEVDFSGQRVGILGTGSSAIQSIPVIARQAAHLTVFQRTPTYTVPARNAPLDREYEARIKADYAGFRQRNAQMHNAFGSNTPRGDQPALSVDDATRRSMFEKRWQQGGLVFMGTFADLMLDDRANETAAQFVRDKIREMVRDPELARKLTPAHRIGCKRLVIDTGFYDTFNRDNVSLVDLRETPLVEITPRGVRTSAGEHELDALVFATGFDAMTGAIAKIDIRGREGLSLREHWSAGPRNYLGLQAAGFPNLFMITGPGSPSVLTNMIVSIEHHVNWIIECLDWLRARGARTIETDRETEDRWVAHVNAVADTTVFPQCNSWYLGANVPGKVRVFMPLLGFPPYVEKCRQVAEHDYEGFVVQ